MRHQTIKIILAVVATIATCFLAVYLFNRPAILSVFNLSNSGNIGSAIGGITAPIIGIATIIFLYVTLNRQIDNNSQQQLKNESDIVFLLLNQLDIEYNNFYLNVAKAGVKEKLLGFEALTYHCDSFVKFHNLQYSFKTYHPTVQIIYIIRSFSLIEKRISISNLSTEMKTLFDEKLKLFYEIKLQDPLEKLSTVFNTTPLLTDEATKEIEIFVSNHK